MTELQLLWYRGYY